MTIIDKLDLAYIHRKIGTVALLIYCSAVICWSVQSNAQSIKTNTAAAKQGAFHLQDLINSLAPQRIVSIDLDLYEKGIPEKPRIAILNETGLHIYRDTDKDALVEEFSLNQPSIPWGHMQSFPSTNRLFGVVLWGSEESSYNPASVICYVADRFKVLFQSSNVTFADLNFDGIPEILVSDYPSETAKEPSQVAVWTWNGKEYVLIGKSAPSELWSQRIVDAIRTVRAGDLGKHSE